MNATLLNTNLLLMCTIVFPYGQNLQKIDSNIATAENMLFVIFPQRRLSVRGGQSTVQLLDSHLFLGRRDRRLKAKFIDIDNEPRIELVYMRNMTRSTNLHLHEKDIGVRAMAD